MKKKIKKNIYTLRENKASIFDNNQNLKVLGFMQLEINHTISVNLLTHNRFLL